MLTAPALIVVLGLPAAESVGTALLFVTAVKSIAAPAYLVRRQVNLSVLLRLLAGGIPGVLAGSLALKRASEAGLGPVVLTIVGLTVSDLRHPGPGACALRRGIERERRAPEVAPGIGRGHRPRSGLLLGRRGRIGDNGTAALHYAGARRDGWDRPAVRVRDLRRGRRRALRSRRLQLRGAGQVPRGRNLRSRCRNVVRPTNTSARAANGASHHPGRHWHCSSPTRACARSRSGC